MTRKGDSHKSSPLKEEGRDGCDVSSGFGDMSIFSVYSFFFSFFYHLVYSVPGHQSGQVDSCIIDIKNMVSFLQIRAEGFIFLLSIPLCFLVVHVTLKSTEIVRL